MTQEEKTFVSENFKWLTYILGGSTFILMLLGGYVRASGAGLACPDWPTCYGKWFPFFDGEVYPYSTWLIFVEWIHRFVAVVVGLFVIIVLLKSWKYKPTHPQIFWTLAVLLISFITQGLFGGFAVLMELSDFFVVAHLANGLFLVFVEMLLAFYATIFTASFKTKYFG